MAAHLDLRLLVWEFWACSFPVSVGVLIHLPPAFNLFHTHLQQAGIPTNPIMQVRRKTAYVFFLENTRQ